MQIPINSPIDMGRLVKKVRTKRGITQQVLSDQLGVSQRWLSELELGKGKQFNERYFEILALLGIRLSADAPEEAPLDLAQNARVVNAPAVDR